jgi:hypothetical protein
MNKISITIIFCFLMVSQLSAQPDLPDAPVPLHGVLLLVAAGAALGIKKLHDMKK